MPGCYGEIKSKEHQIHYILQNAALIRDCLLYPTLLDSLKTSVALLEYSNEPELLIRALKGILTTLYFCFEALRGDRQWRDAVREANDSIIVLLIDLIGKVADEVDECYRDIPIRQLTLLLWKCILYSVGGLRDIRRCKLYTRKLAGLPLKNDDQEAITTSPLDYASFRAELISKYPSYNPPPLLDEQIPEKAIDKSRKAVELPVLENGQWTATPAPSPPPSPKGKRSLYTTDQSMPFTLPPGADLSKSVPVSIEEAAALFQARQRISIPMMQLWQEQEAFVRSERGWTEPVSNHSQCLAEEEAQTLAYVEKIYADSLPHLQSCVSGLVSNMWSHSSQNLPVNGLQPLDKEDAKIEESVANTRGWLFNDKEPAASKSVREIEEFREMEIAVKGATSVLLLLLKWFRASHVLKFEYLTQLIFDSDWVQTFHQVLMSLNPAVTASEPSEPSARSFFRVSSVIAGIEQPRQVPKGARPHTDASTLIKRFNTRVLFNTTQLLSVTQKLVKKKIHRNGVLVHSKTWLHLRRPLKIPHDGIQTLVLKLYRGQIPLCSRKWRMANMRVITQIYMSLKPELREDWIASPEDVELSDAKQHEDAVRALTAFYNARRYDESDDEDDFFATEVSRLKV